MAGINLWAVLAGIGVMVAASGIGGLIFGFGAIADAARRGAQDEDRIEADLEDQLLSHNAQVQLVILSWAATMLGGAVTGSIATERVLTNALIVGLVAFAGAFLPAGPIPRRTMLAAGVISIPAALVGAAIAS